jgi:triacylglycerol lipase
MARDPVEVLGRETLAVGELVHLMGDPVYRGIGVPRGEGRLVLVLPGLFANDIYLQPLRRWLRRVGYRPVRSTLAINVGCPERLCVQIEGELQRQRERHGGRVAIIGHSRGGILGRAIAARLQDDAAALVLLGSPVGAMLRMPSWSAAQIAADPPAAKRVTDVGSSFRRMVDPDCNVPECGCAFPPDLRGPLHLSTRVTSIYSRDDPIVPASACPVDGAHNIEVGGTHSGLAFNRDVYRELGTALAG